MKYSWEYAHLPRAFHNNYLWKIWGANRVHYGELKNRELLVNLHQNILSENWNDTTKYMVIKIIVCRHGDLLVVYFKWLNYFHVILYVIPQVRWVQLHLQIRCHSSGTRPVLLIINTPLWVVVYHTIPHPKNHTPKQINMHIVVYISLLW